MNSIEIAISFYPVHINIHLHRLLWGIEIWNERRKKTETIYIRFMQRVRVEAEIRLLNITACEYDDDATNLYLHSVFVRVSISIAHIRAFQQKKKLLSAHLSFPLVNVNMCVCIGVSWFLRTIWMTRATSTIIAYTIKIETMIWSVMVCERMGARVCVWIVYSGGWWRTQFWGPRIKTIYTHAYTLWFAFIHDQSFCHTHMQMDPPTPTKDAVKFMGIF